jgi:Zinc finger, ZZ type
MESAEMILGCGGRRGERRHRYTGLCKHCGERKARFRYHGIVKSDRDHELCFRCYRSIRASASARALAAALDLPL